MFHLLLGIKNEKFLLISNSEMSSFTSILHFFDPENKYVLLCFKQDESCASLLQETSFVPNEEQAKIEFEKFILTNSNDDTFTISLNKKLMLLVVWNKKFYYLISTETRNNIPPYSTRSFINSIRVFETNNNLHGFLIAKSHFLERLNECGITVFSHIKIPF